MDQKIRAFIRSIQQVQEKLEELGGYQKFIQKPYGRCEICSQPIPSERLNRYPEVSTCVPCQELLEKPERLKVMIAQLHHNLVLMEAQYDAVERLEHISSERQREWLQEICCYREKLAKLRAALYVTGFKRNKPNEKGGSHDHV
jgi:hypothetical protein